jgi:pilus assembly protein Flp/PilA
MYRVDARSDEGASAVEYGLIVFAIAALIVIVVFALGQASRSLYQDSCDKISSQAAPSSDCG